MVTTELLEEIRQNEIEVTEILEEKVLGALAERSVSRRQLSSLTRLKAATIDAVVKSLSGRGLVRMVTVMNLTGGKPTMFISLVKSDEEARKKRLAKMYARDYDCHSLSTILMVSSYY